MTDKSRDELDEIALSWFMQLTSGRIRRDEVRALRRWLDADPSHREAFSRVRSIYMTADMQPELLMAQAQKRAVQGRAPRMALAATVTALLLCSVAWFQPFRADQQTATGEVQRIALADGTIAWLDTDSALDVDFNDTARTVRLKKGRVWFEVAHTGPQFHVMAGGADVTDIGTAFSVGYAPENAVRVQVEQGLVDVAMAGSVERLGAGRQGLFKSGEAPRLADATKADFDWRSGRLTFSNRPLREVLQEVDRYRPGIIYLNDDDIADRPVTALLSLDRLDAGLDALALSEHLKIQRFTPWLVVISRRD
jgi:transmembrane sensor